MFTLALGFIKKLFSSGTSYLFLGIIILIGMFIFFNSNVILSKFGFETTTNLKYELGKSQKDLDTAAKVNENLNKTLDTVIENNTKQVAKIEEVNKTKIKVVEKVNKVTKERATISKETEKTLEEKISVTDTTITLPIEEINQLSTININTLHSAFNDLGFNSPLTS